VSLSPTARTGAYAAASLLAGTVFGLGLALAGMTDPRKVLNFLDVRGTWDASLLLVLGAAVLVSAALFRWILARQPLLDSQFHLPSATRIDAKLITGSALFGVGWGLAGYCPGPALASLAWLNPEALWIVPAMMAGTVLERYTSAH